MAVSKGVLIVNGGLPGLQTALDLADSGLHVDLIESAAFFQYDSVSGFAPHLVNTRLLEAVKHPAIIFRTDMDVEQLENLNGTVRAQLRQRPRYVDPRKCTACGDCLEACPVKVPPTGRKAVYLPKDTQPGIAAVDKQGRAPCSNACPAGIPVQGYVALIGQGRFQEALDLIREHIPFPGICGRICTHPCESKCRRLEIDAPVSIRLLKRFVADWEIKQVKKKKRKFDKDAPMLQSSPVAVVGSGPAGMAAADGLARLGYRVTVFEQLGVIGGMLSVGIPAYRLPREIISREYDEILKLGVKLKLNTPIGPNGKYTIDQLFAKGFKAVCLAVGAHQSRPLLVPGEELSGVVHGIDLLKSISLSQQTQEPQYAKTLESILLHGPETRAIVLGGGNTAMDVSRALKRLGVKEVRILYRRTRKEMPAYAEEIEDALHEGVVMEFLTAPVRVLGDRQGNAIGLECMRMQLSDPDADGRRKPVPIAGATFRIDADLIVPAIGQMIQPGFLDPEINRQIQYDDRIKIQENSFQTGRPGVFAVGDAVTRDKMSAIEAIAMGKKVVQAIDTFLKGRDLQATPSTNDKRPTANRSLSAAEQELKPRTLPATIPLEERLASFTEVERGYTEEQAMTEAQRCLICGPCSECLACEKVCEPGAMDHGQKDTILELDIDAVVMAQEESKRFNDLQSLYPIEPENVLTGSAVAGRIMSILNTRPSGSFIAPHTMLPKEASRIGVFLCECGGHISDAVDMAKVSQDIQKISGVSLVRVLSSSCTEEGIQTLSETAEKERLDRIVLAACSCCSSGQVCYSCSFQRVRCRSALGLFGPPGQNKNIPSPQNQAVIHWTAIPQFELVNIREQCALMYGTRPKEAVQKAVRLIKAALAKLRLHSLRQVETEKPERSVLIMGQGPAGEVCRNLLAMQDIRVQSLTALPDSIGRMAGLVWVTLLNQKQQAGALMLAPQNQTEADYLQTLFREPLTGPAGRYAIRKTRPGIIFCDPQTSMEISGATAAAEVQVWLNRSQEYLDHSKPMIDSRRCRACGTCLEVCHCEAAQLIQHQSGMIAQIDPLVCAGCGACAAWCPSGAIISVDPDDLQLNGMLEALLQ